MDSNHFRGADPTDHRPGEDAGPAGSSESPLEGDLVVVSNRQPYSHEYDDDGIGVDAPAGGLTAGLDPVLQRNGGTWVAWGDGEADEAVVDDEDCVAVPPEDPGYTLRRVWLSEEQVRDYYLGFSNRVLWPICHGALSKVRERESYWDRYREVNEQFVDALAGGDADGSVVWFQDYHFGLAPRMARERLSDDTVVMQFWHVPWPAWDTFRGCPHKEAMLEGLLGNDLLGFHVPRYRENFLECVAAALDGATVHPDARVVTYDGHLTRVADVPLGVPADDIERRATSLPAASFWTSFTDRYDVADTVAVGVDRLDYSKGIPERLRALERLWEEYPEWRGELTYVQNGSESRSRIPAYSDLQDRVEAGVERVNDRFGTEDWDPVVSFRDHVSQVALAGLYRHSDLALVSPIRDGMNLVAQEYVAAQADDDGVLVLSDQAGADDVLEGAVSTTPQDPGAFASDVQAALTMDRDERRARMEQLREWVWANDLSTWTDRILEAADRIRTDEAVVEMEVTR